MKITNKTILKVNTLWLVIISLFTLAQIYYSAYIHAILLVLCFIACYKERRTAIKFLFMAIGICSIFVLLSILNKNGTTMEHVGFYLHYVTWPLIFLYVIKNYKTKEKEKLLYIILLLCIIGDILTLKQLSINMEISRLLAGTHLEGEKIKYYKLGVGGYGYVFAMSFLTFGVVRWLKNTKNKIEKIFLSIFLLINYLFILYASYTTAIIMTVVLTVLAMIYDWKKNSKILCILVMGIFIVIFGRTILRFCYNRASDLGLVWVAKRFGQLLYANENNDVLSLSRMNLYIQSITAFIKSPILGGKIYGGHSQIFDSFARYGIFAILLLFFLKNCMKMCNNLLCKNKLIAFYVVFIVFTCIDTCNVMQIPAVVFFVVPLIMHIEMERKTV